MNIYIGNVSSDTTEDQLRQAFQAFGEVSTVNVITDKYSGDPRGFAFVEMSGRSEAVAAISLAAPKVRLDASRIADLGQQVRAAAQRISAQLGFPVSGKR